MSENYIMLNGKRVDLTEEQLKKLGIKVEVEKDCFKRVNATKCYYFTNAIGELSSMPDYSTQLDDQLYKVANYCTDKSIMQQRAFHETLDRLLWRFSMQNDGDKINWSDNKPNKYYIFYNEKEKEYEIGSISYTHCLEQYFYSREIAQRAIDEIVLPFVKEHPEFVW